MGCVGPAKIRLRARSAVPLLHLRHVAAKDSELMTDDYGFVGSQRCPWMNMINFRVPRNQERQNVLCTAQQVFEEIVDEQGRVRALLCRLEIKIVVVA